MTTEDELRQALAAEAETMKWSLSMHDVVTAEVVHNVVSLDPTRRRRTPLMLSAAAVVGLIGGGSYLAVNRSNNEGRILAGGPKGKVAASNAANSSVGVAPIGPVSLAGMTLLLPKDLPAAYRLQGVSVEPVGSNTGSSTLIRRLILNSVSASDRITITAVRLESNDSVVNTATDTEQTLKVHGVNAQLFNGGPVKDLSWIERGVQYDIAVPASLPDTDMMKLAESLVPADKGSVAFSVPTPTGYAVAYDGDGNLQSPWSYNPQYARENLDKPEDDYVAFDVQPSDGGPLDTLRLLGHGYGPSKTVKVGRTDGNLTTVDPSFGLTSLVWKSPGGLIISLNSRGLSEAEIVAFAESIATVDEATFRAAVGDRLQSNGGFPQPDFTVPGVSTFSGTTDGRAWTMKATPPDPADSPNANCVQLSLDDKGVIFSTCGYRPVGDSFVAQAPLSAGNVVTFAFDIVPGKIRRVVVRDADSNKDIDSVETIAGTGGEERRAYVMVLRSLPKDVESFVFVALDEKAKAVGTPAPHPAAEYPGDSGDPSARGTLATTAPPATIYNPGAAPVPESDPTKLSVFATGTFDGRPWELRKPAGPTPEGPACWYFSFAAGAPQLSCGGNADPRMNLIVVRDRRTFVLASTAAVVTKVKATFKNGRVDEVVPTVSGTDRVAVIAVGLNDVLLSVTAVGANGKDTASVAGTLPGDSSLPSKFGDENSTASTPSAGTVATTAAPVLTAKA
jgi:hypothetical protein